MPHVDRSVYRLVFAGKYAEAGVAPPVHGPSVYRRIAREALGHGLDPLGDPEALARAEGFDVRWGSTPGRTGIQLGSLLILPWDTDPRRRGLRLHHERAHGHLRKHGAPHHSEADVIWLTAELAFPSWLRSVRHDAEHAPEWLAECIWSRNRA
jgi:hypothetical protein